MNSAADAFRGIYNFQTDFIYLYIYIYILYLLYIYIHIYVMIYNYFMSEVPGNNWFYPSDS